MFGAVIREYYKDPEKNGGKRIVSVSIMPCTAKKEEILRPESSTNGKQDIDYVLTTTELITMIRKSGIRFENLEIEASDMPFWYRIWCRCDLRSNRWCDRSRTQASS